MVEELYIFGSVLSGDVDSGSDVDVLAIVNDETAYRHLPRDWSVYTRTRLEELFKRGTLFAWHLYQGSKLIYASGHTGTLSELGAPAEYKDAALEIAALTEMAREAVGEILSGTASMIYEHGLLFLAARDIAMAASSYLNGEFDFSRHCALRLRDTPLPFLCEEYAFLMACRRATTRGMHMHWNSTLAANIRGNLKAFLDWCVHVNTVVKK